MNYLKKINFFLHREKINWEILLKFIKGLLELFLEFYDIEIYQRKFGSVIKTNLTRVYDIIKNTDEYKFIPIETLSMLESLISDKSELDYKLTDLLIKDKIIKSRLEQITFCDFCAKLLTALPEESKKKIFTLLRVWVINSKNLNNIFDVDFNEEIFPWIISHYEFYNSLFYTSNLIGIRKKIIINQIPKTASTTLNTLLTNLFQDKILFIWKCNHFLEYIDIGGLYVLLDCISKIFENELKVVVLGGHNILYDQINLIDKDEEIIGITILRDPIEIIISGLSYFLQTAIEDVNLASSLNILNEKEIQFIKELINNNYLKTKENVKSIILKVIHNEVFKNFVGDPLTRYIVSFDTNVTYDEIKRRIKLIENKITWIIFSKFNKKAVDYLFQLIEPSINIPEYSIPRENVSKIDFKKLGSEFYNWLLENIKEAELIGKSYYVLNLLKKTKNYIEV